MDKNAFSFVELIVVTTILLLLAIVGGAVNSDFKNKTQNTRTVADIETLNNALKSYAQESGTLPFPSGNTNWFGEDASYKENSSIDAFGVYGQVTEATLPRKYLNFLPLDQRT